MDVYLRDFVGDVGDPHDRPIGVSPDVILRTVRVRDPQAEFGPATDTVENYPIENVAVGDTKHVYLRVRNRADEPAVDVPTAVFWAYRETMHDRSTWRAVGGWVFAHVPPGNVLTVSDAIVWHPEYGQPEARRWIALIAWVNHDPGDPLFPFDASFADAAGFERYVQQHNNITLRIYRIVPLMDTGWSRPWAALWRILRGILAWLRGLLGGRGR